MIILLADLWYIIIWKVGVSYLIIYEMYTLFRKGCIESIKRDRTYYKYYKRYY